MYHRLEVIKCLKIGEQNKELKQFKHKISTKHSDNFNKALPTSNQKKAAVRTVCPAHTCMSYTGTLVVMEIKANGMQG